MAENSNIEWTHHTFNPWIGCSKVSDGCKNCYAESLGKKRFSKTLGGATKENPISHWGAGGVRHRTSVANWKKPKQWNAKAAKLGIRQRVFCASLADVFEDFPAQADEMLAWRRDLFQLIVETPHLDWLLLTKRPENVCRMIEEATGFSDAMMWFGNNVWVGTSVENQEQANIRIPHLLRIPAIVRFLSCEPLLGAVDLNLAHQFVPWDEDPLATALMHQSIDDGRGWAKCGIDWVIAGGESGTNARPMHPDWARGLRDQCVDAGVPFFFKQWGEWMPMENGYKRKQIGTFIHGEFQHAIWNLNGECVQNVGTKKAGRLLDGREWNEFPKMGVNDEAV